MARVLILDSDPWTRPQTQRLCRALGHSVAVAADLASARREALDRPVDVVLADIEAGGIDLLEELTGFLEAPQVILTSSDIELSNAVDALRRGARDLLSRPLRADELQSSLLRLGACSEAAPAQNTDGAPEGPARQPLAPADPSGAMIGSSEALRRTVDLITRVARTERSTVLVLGESGSGKELVARAVHDHSSRSEGPFVAVNCAALTDSLLEAELFGYEPGAFTGAARTGREGLLAAAAGGTLLLDEVGELAPALQAKLLRVLQERKYRRVGGSEDHEFDARIVACTHRNLVELVRAGEFREDFFYRLNVLSIHVPPLRERKGDLRELSEHFLSEIGAEFGGPPLELTAEAELELHAFNWPGNVRELRNTLERAALMSTDGRLLAEHLSVDGLGEPAMQPAEPRGELSLGNMPLEECSLRRVEEAVIRHVMGESEGNRSRAARVLGVNRSTLYSKLKTYSIDS